ncbi:MAG: hypothetical protein LBM19_04240 [Holosporales bacterium]|nr:hypothetical protein [Holosporales bacterium]
MLKIIVRRRKLFFFSFLLIVASLYHTASAVTRGLVLYHPQAVPSIQVPAGFSGGKYIAYGYLPSNVQLEIRNVIKERSVEVAGVIDKAPIETPENEFRGFCCMVAHNLLWRLKASSCSEVSRTLYDRAMFAPINRLDFLFMIHMTPDDIEGLKNEKEYLKSLVGSYRAKTAGELEDRSVAAVEFQISLSKLLPELCSERDINFARISGGCWKEVEGALNRNAEKIASSGSIDEKQRRLLPMAIPIRLSSQVCMELIRGLFPGGMFHVFTEAETLLMLHLFPEEGICPWNKLSDEDKDFFTECLIGAMRSRAIRDYLFDTTSQVNMSRYLRIQTADDAEEEHREPASEASDSRFSEEDAEDSLSAESGSSTKSEEEEYNELASKAAREIYTSKGIAIDPEMSDSAPPNWSKIPEAIIDELKEAFSRNKETALRSLSVEDARTRELQAEHIAGGMFVELPTDYVVTLERLMFPEGMFHLFKGAEYMLVNILMPNIAVKQLRPEDRLFLMECLAGAQRSKYINEGIAKPLALFDIKDFPAYAAS